MWLVRWPRRTQVDKRNTVSDSTVSDSTVSGSMLLTISDSNTAAYNSILTVIDSTVGDSTISDSIQTVSD